MTGRQLIIDLIHEVVRGIPVEEVDAYAASLPIQVEEGAEKFCEDTTLGQWFKLQMVAHDVSAAHELYQFIARTQAADQLKEAQASGDQSDART